MDRIFQWNFRTFQSVFKKRSHCASILKTTSGKEMRDRNIKSKRKCNFWYIWYYCWSWPGGWNTSPVGGTDKWELMPRAWAFFILCAFGWFLQRFAQPVRSDSFWKKNMQLPQQSKRLLFMCLFRILVAEQESIKKRLENHKDYVNNWRIFSLIFWAFTV